MVSYVHGAPLHRADIGGRATIYTNDAEMLLS